MWAGMGNNIIIIGGGFGGLRAACDLVSLGAKGRGYRVILLDKSEYHTYTPLLYEVASGCAEELISESKLIGGVSSYLREYALANGFEFYKSEIVGADFLNKKILLSDGSDLSFSAVIFAPGAETDFLGIEGLREAAFTLKTVADALRVRRRLLGLIEEKKKGRPMPIRIIVGGGGATGVEFAAELTSGCLHLVRLGVLAESDWSITLVEAGPRILSTDREKVSYRARRRLENLGVKVLRDTCIKRVEGERVVLAPGPLNSGESAEVLLCDFRPESENIFAADMIVWAGGIRANSLLEKVGLPVDKKGRVRVADTLEVQGWERQNIYALGDCALLLNPQTNLPVPALAQAAIACAKVAAKNIIYDLEGFKSRVHYTFRSFPTITPLGGKNALATYGERHIWGLLGWMLRRAADLRYFLSILPLGKALKIWLTGALIYSHND